VLAGDAAASNDPSWGQGLSLTLRDVRVLRDRLLATSDWETACRDYAREHDRHYGVIHEEPRVLANVHGVRTRGGCAARTRPAADCAGSDACARSSVSAVRTFRGMTRSGAPSSPKLAVQQRLELQRPPEVPMWTAPGTSHHTMRSGFCWRGSTRPMTVAPSQAFGDDASRPPEVCGS